jgi:hypothetical protein
MTVELYGTDQDTPVDHRIYWMYPANKSTLTIDVCHVRVIDDIRLEFDFGKHEWVAFQELQAATDHEPATGKWVEVARWSGNAPDMGTEVKSDA